jgi:hypothetical protein
MGDNSQRKSNTLLPIKKIITKIKLVLIHLFIYLFNYFTFPGRKKIYFLNFTEAICNLAHTPCKLKQFCKCKYELNLILCTNNKAVAELLLLPGEETKDIWFGMAKFFDDYI